MKRSHKGTRPPEKIVPCMPPMLEEEKIPLDRSCSGTKSSSTKYGGTSCEHAMAMFLLSQKIKPKYSLSIFFISLINFIKFTPTTSKSHQRPL